MQITEFILNIIQPIISNQSNQYFKFKRFPISVGMVPRSEFWYSALIKLSMKNYNKMLLISYNSFNFVKAPMSVGIVPVREFTCRYLKICSLSDRTHTKDQFHTIFADFPNFRYLKELFPPNCSRIEN